MNARVVEDLVIWPSGKIWIISIKYVYVGKGLLLLFLRGTECLEHYSVYQGFLNTW